MDHKFEPAIKGFGTCKRCGREAAEHVKVAATKIGVLGALRSRCQVIMRDKQCDKCVYAAGKCYSHYQESLEQVALVQGKIASMFEGG